MNKRYVGGTTLKLKAARAKLGLSQSQAAQEWGMPLRTLISWENDQSTPRGFALTAVNEKLDAILASPPAADEFALRQRHARIIRRSARILGIPAQVFFSWQMDYVTAALDDPDGLINEYAIGKALEFPDQSTRQEVRQRFEAWLRTKGVPAARVRHIMSRTTQTEEEAA